MQRIQRAACGILVVTLAACSLSELEPDSNSVRVKDVVDLQREGDTSAVLTRFDSAVTFVAHIPEKATVKTVVFTTSAGFFVLTGTKEATVHIEADSLDPKKRWAARVALRRDTLTVAPFAIVSATVATYRDTARVRFR